MINNIESPILITGSSGFIGSNLTRKLADKHSDIHILVRKEAKLWRIADILPKITVHYIDLVDRDDVFSCVKKIKPKTIFHLAVYGAYPFQKDIKKIEAITLHGTMNLLDACIESGFRAFINTGSSSEYGFKTKPMKETDFLEPNSHYAVFKAAATYYCQYLAKSKKLPIITIRPFSVYGPYEEPTRLIPTLINSLLSNTCPPLVSPDTARDYVYIDDMIDAYIAASQKTDLVGEIFNIGSGKQATLKEIVDLAILLTKATIKPKWGTMEQRIWDQNIWEADISKAKTMLNWSPKNNLQSGLTKTINWLKNNINLYK